MSYSKDSQPGYLKGNDVPYPKKGLRICGLRILLSVINPLVRQFIDGFILAHHVIERKSLC